MPTALLRQKLGATAFAVWKHMLGKSERGWCRVSRADLRAAGWSPKQVRRSLERLRAAALLGEGHHSGERHVAGELDGRTARVPLETAGWCEETPHHGGRRRRRVQEGPTKRALPRGPYQEGPTGTPKGGQPETPLRGVQAGGFLDPESEEPSFVPIFASQKSKLVRGADAARHVRFFSREHSMRSEPLDAAALFANPLVPPRPSIRAPRVPPPPLLDPSADPIDQAIVLATLYRGACQKFYALDYKGFIRGVEKSKHRALLERSAATMVQHKIAPGVVVRNRFRWWRHQKQPKAPPVPVVFGPASLAKQAAQLAGESVDARLEHGPELKELNRRWAGMQLALLGHARSATDDETIRAIVSRFFPGDLYEQLKQAASAAAAETSEAYAARAAAGAYLW